MYAAYWHKNGLEIYRLAGRRIEPIASGALADLRPLKALGRKLLIVSSLKSLHVRKRYPAMAEKDVKKAVGNEIEELFPIPDPSFHCRIFEKEKMYTLVDVWAWETAETERIKEIFNFSYIVPEELAYVSTQPEVILRGDHDIASVSAYAEGKFLGSTSFVGAVTLEGLNLFIKSLGRYAAELKILKVYGDSLPDLRPENLEVRQLAKTEHPLCLDGINDIGLKQFHSQTTQLATGISLALRTAVYVALAYAIGLFLTIRNYDSALDGLNQKRVQLTKTLAAGPREKQKDHSQALAELEKKLQSRVSPLEVMEVLADRLPPRSSLVRLAINEGKAETTIACKDPLDVINALSRTRGIRSVKVRGAPTKDRQADSYNLVLELGL